MGLRITDISLTDFRNYERFSLADVGNLTVLTGRNGVGKTNVLEAVQLMTSASSFRHPTVAQLIRDGADRARVQMEATDGNRRMTTTLSLEPGKRRYAVNGKTKQAADVRGTLPAVVFTPDDLQLAKKSSGVKRDAIDDLGAQLSRSYHVVLADYEKTLRYKNRLLKDEAAPGLIAAINETLVTCGSQLFCFRVALYSRLLPHVQRLYSEIVQAGDDTSEGEGEAFTASYLASWDYLAGVEPADGMVGTGSAGVSGNVAGAIEEPRMAGAAQTGSTIGSGGAGSAEGAGGIPFAPSFEMRDNGAPNREQVKERLYQGLEAATAEEARRGRSLVGPHNDKLAFYLAGRDASAFASQGQQRSIVLAWKLAEVEVIRQALGTNPVLLLDDVMSELDERRRDTLVDLASEDVQTIITATDLSGFNPALLARAQVVAL